MTFVSHAARRTAEGFNFLFGAILPVDSGTTIAVSYAVHARSVEDDLRLHPNLLPPAGYLLPEANMAT